MDLLEQLANLTGAESVDGLAQRMHSALARSGEEINGSPEDLLVALAQRDGSAVARLEDLTPAGVLSAVSAIDPRVGAMTTLARRLGYSESTALSHEELVKRIYEDPRFIGKEAKAPLVTLTECIARRCDSSISEDDLDVFVNGALPSAFFYETVSASVEAAAAADDVIAGVEDDEEVDEDVEPNDEPVRAYLEEFYPKLLLDLISGGELDIRPAWQRTDVWSLKRKRELVKSLILGIPLPSIILHKNSRQGTYSIIDGKQRLLAIHQFAGNTWKLPKYEVRQDNPLYRCRGAFYSNPSKASLPQDIRRQFDLRKIPALVFEDVSERRLRAIFHLYNVAGMKLNGAEIRNAVYQANPIHQACYVLAGEGVAQIDLGVGGLDIQNGFTKRLRAIYPGANKRYQGVDFIARYLGYSRAAQADETKPFTPPSTSTAINLYFDYASGSESASAVSREIIDVLAAAELFFDLPGDRLAFFSRGSDGKRKFSKLAATTYMVAARILGDAIESEVTTVARAHEIADEAYQHVPDKQQSATIWDFQARVVLRIRDLLGADAVGSLHERWGRFFEKMEACILPPDGVVG